MKRFLDYNKKLKERAAQMRKDMTKAERKLWFECLKKFPLTKGDGTEWQEDWKKVKVYRQRIINQFIVDFYIPDYKLVIELDWETHGTEQAKAYDEERTQILESMWCTIIRFTNTEIYDEFEWVCEILMNIHKSYNPSL